MEEGTAGSLGDSERGTERAGQAGRQAAQQAQTSPVRSDNKEWCGASSHWELDPWASGAVAPGVVTERLCWSSYMLYM